MVTIRDVARRAGVSVATAARALGNYGYVRTTTRQRVRRAAQALDYHPNVIARSMIKGRTHTLAVIVSDNANPFFAAAVRGIEDVVLPHGYGILLCNADEDADKESMYLRVIRERRADGLILSPSGGATALLRTMIRSGLPIVQIDRRLDGVMTDAVVIDNRAGVRAATEHLLQLGHRRIGMIAGPRRLYTGRERLEAFLTTMRRAGVAVDRDLVVEGDFKAGSAYERVGTFLQMRRRPTALFVANNLMTIGALLGLKEAGVRIPQDMAIIGFDDMEWAPILTPPLTAVAQPGYALGATAAELLMGRLNTGGDRAAPRTVVLQPKLVVRESCGARMRRTPRSRLKGAPR